MTPTQVLKKYVEIDHPELPNTFVQGVLQAMSEYAAIKVNEYVDQQVYLIPVRPRDDF